MVPIEISYFSYFSICLQEGKSESQLNWKNQALDDIPVRAHAVILGKPRMGR